MTYVELVDEIIKDGMLKNKFKYYEDLEEAILLYLDIYKKSLIEILKEIPLSLYNKLEARRLDAVKRDREIKEVALLELCATVNNVEMKRCIDTANRTIFSSKS